MPQKTFDLILRGGVVANQDGIAPRDIGVTGETIAAIGDLSQASAGRWSIAPACISFPA